jgi:hypothetical protein
VEISWKNGTGQADDDLVADFEVARAADDTANVFAAIGSFLTLASHTNLTPANGLAVGLCLWREFENLAHDHGPCDTETVRAFLFQANLDQFGHNAVCGYVTRKVNVFGKP